LELFEEDFFFLFPELLDFFFFPELLEFFFFLFPELLELLFPVDFLLKQHATQMPMHIQIQIQGA